jgi:hypothetical protein
MAVSRNKETAQKTRALSTADSAGRRSPSDFKALRYFAESERDTYLRGWGDGRPMDVAAFRAAEDHVRLIRTLVRPLLVAGCDYPDHETGLNARGGHTYALLFQLPRDVWPVDPSESAFANIVTRMNNPVADFTEEAPFFVACEADSWEELYAAVEAKSRAGEWWTRAVGQRQAVYDWVYSRRFQFTGDDEDSLDLAIGAADMPLLDLVYFAEWCAAAPREVREHPVALRVLKTLAGDKAEAYLAEPKSAKPVSE